MKTHFGLSMAILLLLLACRPLVKIDEPFRFPNNENLTVFGARKITYTVITNRSGKPIPGIVIHGASVLRNNTEFATTRDQKFVVFFDFLLGKGAASRYWRQQANRSSRVGSEFLVTSSSTVAIISTTTNKIVIDEKRLRIAHVALGVSPNDFERRFDPANH